MRGIRAIRMGRFTDAIGDVLQYLPAADILFRTGRVSLGALAAATGRRLSVERGDELIGAWASAVVRAAAPVVTVVGAEHLDRRGAGACILMSNHQSHFDIPLLFSVFPGTLRMVAKEELFRVPVWGAAMRSAGFISVKRSGDRTRARGAMQDAAEAIRGGVSIWLAPEGTRSEDGELGAFKKGGFHLALATGTPLVPLVLQGSRNILPKHGGLKVKRGVEVRIVAGPPIDVRGRSLDSLMAEVRAFMQGVLAG